MEKYYREYAKEYFDRTVEADSSAFLSGFLAELEPFSSVTDIGCGSGRDLLCLKQNGMNPKGIERSPELARIAERCN